MDEVSLNDECPKCGDEGAYFDFNHWECPNCGYSWGWINHDDEEEEEEEEENEAIKQYLLCNAGHSVLSFMRTAGETIA